MALVKRVSQLGSQVLDEDILRFFQRNCLDKCWTGGGICISSIILFTMGIIRSDWLHLAGAEPELPAFQDPHSRPENETGAQY